MSETKDLTSFFETFDGYYWVTDEWLLRDAFLDFITPMCSHMQQAEEQDFIDLFPDFLYFLLKEGEVR